MKIKKSERILISPGYRMAYQPLDSQPVMSKNESRLRKLRRGKTIQARQVRVRQQPKGLTEAQLLRALEGAGVGRPSTYAEIVADLLRRSYVRKAEQQIIITPRGRAVQVYLSRAFPRLFDLSFSADLEAQLDGLAKGRGTYEALVSEIWHLVERA
jgi:DNA topoisomerase-1